MLFRSEIIKDAELVDAKKRISILLTYEKIFMFFKLSFANIFPEISSIVIKPNIDRYIKIQRSVKKCEIKIPINEAGKMKKFAILRSYLPSLWKVKNHRMTLGSEIFKKILEYVKTRT